MTAETPQLLVADSFRVRSNPRTGVAEARGLSLHIDRFTRTALAAWPGSRMRALQHEAMHRSAKAALYASDPAHRSGNGSFFMLGPTSAEQRILDEVTEFLDSALPQIAAFGEGFPRLELWKGQRRPGVSSQRAAPELRVSLRPLPALSDTIALRTAGHVALTHPERKGPNIAKLAELNRELGAEALLTDARGNVVEGATTSILWWDASDQEAVFTAPPEYWQRDAGGSKKVDSVTAMLIGAATSKRLVGSKPHRRRSGGWQSALASPHSVTAHEVWAVNALHGIRPVTSIDGVALRAPDEPRLRWYREALDRTWEPLPEK